MCSLSVLILSGLWEPLRQSWFFQRWLWGFVTSDVNVPFSTLLPVTHCTASVSHYKVLIHRGLWPRLSGGWEMLSWQWDVNIMGQIFSRDKNPARSLQLKGRLLIHVENSWPQRDHKVQCPWASATLCSQDQNVFLPLIPLNFDFCKSPFNCFILQYYPRELWGMLCVLSLFLLPCYWISALVGMRSPASSPGSSAHGLCSSCAEAELWCGHHHQSSHPGLDLVRPWKSLNLLFPI